MKLSKILLMLAVILSASLAFAHGENKVGPNGGEIRMPGAFHTEAIAMDKHKLKIYLLDIDFKHPTVEDSSVEASFSGHHKVKADCVKDETFFLCSFGKEVDLNGPGMLEIKPVYKNQAVSVAAYKTPLKYQSIQRLAKVDSSLHLHH